MAFTDPLKDHKNVPFHVMEDLISGNMKLVQKFFLALIHAGYEQQAIGLYIR